MSGAHSALVPVRIVGLPLEVYRRASEHTDELLREFALIRGEGSDHVPARLLALMEELRSRFAAFTQGPTGLLQAALDRGDAEIDLQYNIPKETQDAVRRLGTLLAEADAFCRAGDLLTLATPPEGLAFRRWFLDEFSRQIDGHPAQSWSAFMGGASEG
ncbi:MAG: hypothetical protein ACR2KK_07985 [Acidimicrobiales bacterium]